MVASNVLLLLRPLQVVYVVDSDCDAFVSNTHAGIGDARFLPTITSLRRKILSSWGQALNDELISLSSIALSCLP